jgi:2-polyprenyl-3-methyl-5-hydroxy-6-metoxy-1,4-benzoquinol methylase
MGIVAYEIAKLCPKSIHGIDISRKHIAVARSIFLAVPIPSRFDALDIGGGRFLKALDGGYDIVVMLGLYQHLPRTSTYRTAVRKVAQRCRSAVIFRDPENRVPEIEEIFREFGFSQSFRSERLNVNRLTVLKREQHAANASP